MAVQNRSEQGVEQCFRTAPRGRSIWLARLKLKGAAGGVTPDGSIYGFLNFSTGLMQVNYTKQTIKITDNYLKTLFHIGEFRGKNFAGVSRANPVYFKFTNTPTLVNR